jgi:hypothetical protein
VRAKVPDVLFFRHARRLAADFLLYARLNRAWWLIPLAALLMVAIALGTATQAVVPYAVYTFF